MSSIILPTDVDVKDFRDDVEDVTEIFVEKFGNVYQTNDGETYAHTPRGWQNTYGRPMNEAVYTYTSRLFWVRDPHIDDICVEDFAHGLSMENRFTGTMGIDFELGQADLFIPLNVAQHSVNLYQMVPDQHKRAAIVHDIPEAYIRDIPHPIKRIPAFAELYGAWEQRIFDCVAEKYRFDPSIIEHPDFKFYDRIMGHIEMTTFFGREQTQISLKQLGFNDNYLNLIDDVITQNDKIVEKGGPTFISIMPSVSSKASFTRIFNENF